MGQRKTIARGTRSLQQSYRDMTKSAEDSPRVKLNIHKEHTLNPFGTKTLIEPMFPSIVQREPAHPKPSPQKKIKTKKALCEIFESPSKTEAPSKSQKRTLNDNLCAESPVKAPHGQLTSASPLSVIAQSRLVKPFTPNPIYYKRETEKKFPLITENYKRVKEQRKNSDEIKDTTENLEIKPKKPKIEDEATSSLDEIIPSKNNEQISKPTQKIKHQKPRAEEKVAPTLDEIIPSLNNEQIPQLTEKIKSKKPKIEEKVAPTLDEIFLPKKEKEGRVEDKWIELASQQTQQILPDESEIKHNLSNSRYSLRSSSSNQSFCMLDSAHKPRKKRTGFADGIGTESNPLDLDESSQHISGNTPEKDKTDPDKHSSSDNQAETAKRKTIENEPTKTHKDSSSNDKKPSLSSMDVLKYPPDSQRCITLTRMDLEFLRPETYINDSIVEFYMLYLDHEVVPKGERDDYYFFSPFFFSRLKDINVKDLNRLERWTKDLCIQKRKFLIMPIHMPEHWCLSIICLQKGVFKDMEDNQCILYFDSLGPLAEARTERKIRRWVEYELLKSEGKVDEFKINEQQCFSREEVPFFSLDLPLQQNYTDCGLFILHYAELFITKRPEKIADFKMWFDPKDTRTKRKNILKLIKYLSSPKEKEKKIENENDDDESGNESEDEDKSESGTDCDDVNEKGENEKEDKKKSKIDKEKEKEKEIDRIKASQTEEYDDFDVSSNSTSKLPSDITDIPSSSSSSISSNRTTQSQDILASETSQENI